MGEVFSSVLIGTSGLFLVCLAALVLTLQRSVITEDAVVGVRFQAAVLLVLQVTHFIEEYLYQFYIEFPSLLGLQAWPMEFFIVFNLSWILIWALAIAGISVFPRVAIFPLWFLAMASMANGLIHPAIAIRVAAYFPGLFSSVFVGFFGVILFRRLLGATMVGNPGAGSPGQ